MGMTEREELTVEIAALEARRAALMTDETRLHNAFMVSDDLAETDLIGAELENVWKELDEIRAMLWSGVVLLYLIEARISRREFLEDHPVGGRML
jgi:hypothetical protein